MLAFRSETNVRFKAKVEELKVWIRLVQGLVVDQSLRRALDQAKGLTKALVRVL